MKVGICDDSRDIINILYKAIKRVGEEENHPIDVTAYENPLELIEEMTDGVAKYDMVFLDIDMPELNGIETGKLIRNIDRTTLIVYLTGYRSYSLEAFEVRAYHYLLKPVDKEKIRGIFREYFEFENMIKEIESKKVLTLEFKGGIVKIPIEDILFIEKYRNQVKVVCWEMEHLFYTTLKEIMGRLDDGFIQCHQGFIVKKKAISKIENSVITIEDKYKIPVSKKNLDKVKVCFFDDLIVGGGK